MASTRSTTRRLIDSQSKSFGGPQICWDKGIPINLILNGVRIHRFQGGTGSLSTEKEQASLMSFSFVFFAATSSIVTVASLIGVTSSIDTASSITASSSIVATSSIVTAASSISVASLIGAASSITAASSIATTSLIVADASSNSRLGA
ncbi:unnamed protein product [Lactuca saligna]|uniref:Uncharacterized protein n=1 Tax=Lactuca saligna TaxID=75948 RepID=A0AA36EEF0_LACSI|nr:unnamed protein product [Lactuca saligna]